MKLSRLNTAYVLALALSTLLSCSKSVESEWGSGLHAQFMINNIEDSSNQKASLKWHDESHETLTPELETSKREENHKKKAVISSGIRDQTLELQSIGILDISGDGQHGNSRIFKISGCGYRSIADTIYVDHEITLQGDKSMTFLFNIGNVPDIMDLEVTTKYLLTAFPSLEFPWRRVVDITEWKTRSKPVMYQWHQFVNLMEKLTVRPRENHGSQQMMKVQRLEIHVKIQGEPRRDEETSFDENIGGRMVDNVLQTFVISIGPVIND